MKKIGLMLLLALAATRLVFAVQYSCPVDLDISGMSASVEEVLVIRVFDNGITTTNSVTPTSGAFHNIDLAASTRLIANLKPGYTNARFRCEQGEGDMAIEVMVNSGSTVPFHTVDSITWTTYVKELLVEPMTFVLNFDADGGTVNPASKSITYGDIYGTLPTPTRTGYVFQGWQDSAGTTWTGNETVETLENQTFTAAWQPISYKVKFNNNEADASGSMADQTFAYDEEKPLSSNAFTRVDYKFSCWTNAVTGLTYSDQQKVKNLAAVEDEEVTLTAVWVPKTYEIRYHRNYSNDVYQTQTVTYGETVELFPSITRIGYTCSGWAKSETATVAEFSCAAPVSTVSEIKFNSDGVSDLYAVWRANTYTVTFNANGGEGSTAPMDRFFNDGASLSDCTFTRDGYSFLGWSFTAAGDVERKVGYTENLSDRDGANVVLYAVWTPNHYTITFDANGENITGSMDDVSATWDVPQNLAECVFFKDGYDFQGWALDPYGEVVYANGVPVSNLTTEVDGTVTLYARWKPQTYAITLDPNGGCFFTNIIEVTTNRIEVSTNEVSGVVMTNKVFTSTTTNEVTSVGITNLLVTVDEEYGAFPAVTNKTVRMVFDGWRRPRGVKVLSTDRVPPLSAGVTNLVARWVKKDPLASAVDSPALEFDSSSEYGKGAWTDITDMSAVNTNSVHAKITGGTWEEVMKLTTRVVGPGKLTFKWKILSISEPVTGLDMEHSWDLTPERLFFDFDNETLWGIVGTANELYRYDFTNNVIQTEVTTNSDGWVTETLEIKACPSNNIHTLSWTFHCIDEIGIPGEAWVDDVRWVQDEVTVTIGEVPEHYTAKYVVGDETNNVDTTTGKFTLPGITTGVKVVYVADEGYEPKIKEVLLANGGALEMDIELLPEDAPILEAVPIKVADLPEHITALTYSFVTNGVTVTNTVVGSSFKVPVTAKDIVVKLGVEDGWTATPSTLAVSLDAPSVTFDKVVVESVLIPGPGPEPVPPVTVTVATLPEHVTALSYSFKTNGVEVSGTVSGDAFEVPAEATEVKVQLVVEDGWTATPSTFAVSLSSPSVTFDGVKVEPVAVPVEKVTVKVPSVAHYTAQVVVDGVAQPVVDGQVEIEKGKTGVKIVYVAEAGYTPERKEIVLGELTGDVEVPADEVPSTPTLKKLTVTVPSAEHYTAKAEVNGVAVAVVNGSFTVDYGTANVVVVYVADEGWEPAEKRVVLANGEALVANATVAESQKPVAQEIPEPMPPMLEGSGTVKLPKKLVVGKKATWKAKPDNGCVFMGWTSTDEAGALSLAQLTEKKLAKTSLSAPVTAGMTLNSIVPVWKRMDEVIPAGSGVLMTWCDTTQGKVSKSAYVKLGRKKSVRATALRGWVFAGWYADPQFKTPFDFNDGKDFRKTSHTVLVNGAVHVFARFVPKTAAGDPIVGLTYVGLDGKAAASDVWTLGVPVEVPGVDFESASLPTITMKKLPKGTKWDKKKMMITGKPKKEGVYEAIISVKNASKIKAEFKVTITVVAHPQ